MLPLRDYLQTRSVPGVNYLLIGTNVVVFGLEVSGVIPVSPDGTSIRGALVPADLVAHPWPNVLELFSHMFLHGGIQHIAGNMLFLWIFGDNVEDFFGHFGYLLFYLACGIGSGLVHVIFNLSSGVPAIGASGAIAGVLGAYILLYPGARILTLVFIFLVPLPAVFVLGAWFVLQVLEAVNSFGLGPRATGGVALWAHVGGFIIGLLIARWTLSRGRRSRLSRA